jgi:quercetin dioxygenase-like cupin family protein
MRYIVVEPFKSDVPGAAATTLPHHVLETENERVRIYRLKLAAGESMEPHSHSAGRVEVTVTGTAGVGAWSWIRGGENHPLQVPPTAPALEVVEIEPK